MASITSVALLLGILCASVVFGQTATGPRRPAQDAVPLEPLGAIMNALESHSIVVLGESHNEPRVHAVRLALIRHARFPSLVDDIVLESGGSQYQEGMDRFVRGEPMPDGFLRDVLSGAAPTFMDLMYEDIPKTVRDVNRGLNPQDQVRIILGESPDHRDRDAFVTEVMRREVLVKQRRALAIYGNSHTLRRHAVSVEEIDGQRWLVNRLEQLGARVFAIWAATGIDLSLLQPSISAWRVPALAVVKDTPLGTADFAFYHSFGQWRMKDRQPVMVNGHPTFDPPRPGLRMEEQVDAVLYLGP